MYLDKLYTKLYSDKNWDGLSQLISEIRVFARRDYEGLTPEQKSELRHLRNKIAHEMGYRHSKISAYDFMNRGLFDLSDRIHKGEGSSNADIRDEMQQRILEEMAENSNNARSDRDEALRLADLGRKVTSNYRSNKLSSKWNPFKSKIDSGISKSDKKLLGI